MRYELLGKNDVSKMDLGFPRDFLASDKAKDLVSGRTAGKIDNYRG